MKTIHTIVLICAWFMVICLVQSEFILPTSLKKPIFEGTKCFPNSIYPAEVCMVATKSCCCSSTCVQWEEGKLFLDQIKQQSIEAIPKPCRVNNFTRIQNADVQVGWYRYHDDCEISLFNPIDTDTILQKHMVVFVGDSIVRQLFHRLLWHLRGFEEIVEHFYHANAIYARNGTHDRFVVGTEDLYGYKHYNLPINPIDVIEHPTVILVFIFDPLLKDPDLVTALFQPDYAPKFQKVLITGMHFWFKKQMASADILQYIQKLVSNRSPTNALIPIWFPNWSIELHAQQIEFLELAQKLGYHILPSMELVNTHAFQPNHNELMHYQCSYLRKIHQQLTLNDFKTPPNADCRDLFNLNLVQIVLNIILGMQKRASILWV